MGATLIVDGPVLVPILFGTHLPTAEGWKADLAWRREDIGISIVMTSTGNWAGVASMVAYWFTHYATVPWAINDWL